MDPVVLAMLTSSLTLIAKEATKAVSSQAAKDLWAEAKSLLGFQQVPKDEDLPREIAEVLNNNEALAGKIAKLIQAQDVSDSSLQSAVSVVSSRTTPRKFRT